VDQYDVFLLQGLGQRHWAISTDPDAPKDFRPDVELKQLVHFEPTHEWLLEPGDMLYLPPGVPHDGVAFGGPCMTFSVGMRAPSQAELIGDFADYLADRLPEEARYTDPELAPARHPGEIDRSALERLRAVLPFTTAYNDATLLDWFGQCITRYRLAQHPAPSDRPTTEAALDKLLAKGAGFLRHPWSRMAWARTRAGCTLFVNGQAHPASVALAQRLCAQREFVLEIAPDATERALLITLLDDGHLIPRKASRR
jgi:50S ribosomal protein L16 3-hydroxylase